MARAHPQVHGVLLLDKPAGLSSNAALQRARKLFGWPKAGHTGTLDPLATGLLPLCFGEATKYAHVLIDADKHYEAVVRLGWTSTTGDAEGQLTAVAEPEVSREDLERTLAAFRGAISQLPPMHSALKHKGRNLYDYARAGETVDRTPRNILINELELLEFKEKNEFRIRVRCSKGTYIRVLAQDLGQALGCGAYLLGLRRTGVGRLRVEDAIGLEALENLPETARLAALRPVDALLEELPGVKLPEEGAGRVSQGLAVRAEGAKSGLCRLYGPDGRFLGLGNVDPDGTIRPKRMVSAVPGAAETPVSP